ncbi:hypothetical protein [Natrinema versiforme]|uniref:Uncharacterized protein n=1 Tax=Natrinema versiforme TaxID=88724 RepID=A0A4V1G0C6_9EURY|nr:hypothetical protein [Natrinema versiforme]QCS44876.1 hypothetical protein FEJ81_21545 [Natrinema versiforme]
MRRRSLIKAVGVSASTLCMPVMASAAKEEDGNPEEFKRDMRRSIEIGHTEGQEAREEFLEKKGYGHTSIEIYQPLSLGSDDGEGDEQNSDSISPSSVNDPQDGGIRAYISASGGNSGPSGTNMFASLSIGYEFSASCNGQEFTPKSHGENPRDAAGIAWNTRQNEYFKLADDGGESAMETTGNATWSEDLHDPTVGRTGFRFDDAASYEDWEDDNVNNYDCGLVDVGDEENGYEHGGTCGVYLTSVGDWSKDQRVVRASYTHAHASVAVSPTLSFSATGPAIGFSPEYRITDHKVMTGNSGDDLEVYQSEIRPL